jgi:hypothetical protein
MQQSSLVLRIFFFSFAGRVGERFLVRRAPDEADGDDWYGRKAVKCASALVSEACLLAGVSEKSAWVSLPHACLTDGGDRLYEGRWTWARLL